MKNAKVGLVEYSRKVALVYGEKCNAHFLALAKEGGPNPNLPALVEQAVEATYAEQFHTGDTTMGALRFNSR